MSKLLESLSASIKKTRNLTYYGCYRESRDNYSSIIDNLQRHIPIITDRKLAEEWNRLLSQMKEERFQVDQMLAIITQTPPPRRATPKEDDRLTAEPEYPPYVQVDEMRQAQRKPKLPFGKEPFKKCQDDGEVGKEQRDPLDWGPPPTLPKKPTKPKVQPQPATNQNKSNVDVSKKREQYQRPWAVNQKKQGKDKPAEDPNQKKTFLKHVYPEGSGPDADLINMLEREVIDLNPNVKFDDIAELERAKELLEQAVLMPLQMPQLFKGIRRAWKGVLMFGPPGTGKTMLAKAIASTGKTTFFNVTSSSLASKWKGESEKLVRLLFEMAKFYAPSTLFIDEIDALASKRGEKEDESSRKVKTELLTRMDGASTGGQDQKKIVVIGATNRPWDLDQAIRRRLEKRIYIPLPTDVGRLALLKICLKTEKLAEDVNLDEVVKQTSGYSGADITNLCREAAYMPMRRKLKQQGGFRNIDNIQNFQQEVNVPLTMNDFIEAVRNVKPSVGTGDLVEYEKWMDEYGENGTKK